MFPLHRYVLFLSSMETYCELDCFIYAFTYLTKTIPRKEMCLPLSAAAAKKRKLKEDYMVIFKVGIMYDNYNYCPPQMPASLGSASCCWHLRRAIIEHIAYKIMLLLYYTDVKMHRSWWIDDRNEHRWERPSTLANGKHDILSHSWDSVADGGPTLTQRVLNVSCLLHGGGDLLYRRKIIIKLT